MRASTATLMLATTLMSTARATDREFREIVQLISDDFHTRPMHIPLFGLVNMVTFVARPAGTRHINLAVFENLSEHNRDGRDLAQSIRNAVGLSWKPLVQVKSNRDGKRETVYVFLRQQADRCKLLVSTLERDEATVVELDLKPEALQRWIASPRDSAKHP